MLKANRIGLVGIVIALFGIGVAAFQDDLRAKFDDAPGESVETVVRKGFALFSNVKVEEQKHDKVDYVYISLGLIALVLGVWSYIVKENHRISAVAGALGVVAMAWHYVMIGLVIAVVVFFLGSFS